VIEDADARLYTVVMEFEGMTSVSQFKASSARDALELWLASPSLEVAA
jgi:hypothetical protein